MTKIRGKKGEEEEEDDSLILLRCWRQQSCSSCLDTSSCNWCPFVCLLFLRPTFAPPSMTLTHQQQDAILHPKHLCNPSPRPCLRRKHLPVLGRTLGSADQTSGMSGVNHHGTQRDNSRVVHPSSRVPHLAHPRGYQTAQETDHERQHVLGRRGANLAGLRPQLEDMEPPGMGKHLENNEKPPVNNF